MKRLFLLLLGLPVVWFAGGCKVGGKEGAPKPRRKVSKDEAKVVKGNNEFAFSLYAKLRAEKEGNLFFSPYSISTALAMTYAGARGDTAEEMAKTLRFSLKPKRLHPAFKDLITDLNQAYREPACQLTIATSLWGQTGYSFLPRFLELAAENYQAEVHTVDFRQKAEKARQIINAWVEKETQKKITELIKPGMVDDNTLLVLGNAIYFKARWAWAFPKQDTKKEAFRLTGEKKIPDVPMMHQTRNFLFFDGDSFQLLKLPYRGGNLDMVLLLPKKVNGLDRLEQAVTEDKLDGLLARTSIYEVNVILPKFKITSAFNLKEVLSKMGMPLAFSNEADFSRMERSKELMIKGVLHKAYVDVNEDGTEAAAVTKGTVESKSEPSKLPPKATFRADHPFIFLIRDRHTGSILFIGRMTNPRKG